MLTAWACGTPTTDPQLQIITNELRDSIRPSLRPHSAKKASVTPSPIPHGMKGHMPHDGPFTPDVDGSVYALVGIEVGHTDYGMVRLLPDKTARQQHNVTSL